MKWSLASAIGVFALSGSLFGQSLPRPTTLPTKSSMETPELKTGNASRSLPVLQNEPRAPLLKISRTLTIPEDKALKSPSGGADPGGGGFIQQNGQLKSLAEAGIIFEKADRIVTMENSPDIYLPEEDTKAALKQILSRIVDPRLEFCQVRRYARQEGCRNMERTVYEEILNLSDRATFRKNIPLNPAEYEAIKADYLRVVLDFRQNLDPSALVLAAYSKEAMTFVLPAFFQLSPAQKALNLIHEWVMRTETKLAVKDRLKLALQIDSQIFKLFRGPASDKLSLDFNLAMIELRPEFVNMNVINEILTRQGGQQLLKIETVLGRPILASELTLKPGFYYREATVLSSSLTKKYAAVGVQFSVELEKMIFLPGVPIFDARAAFRENEGAYRLNNTHYEPAFFGTSEWERFGKWILEGDIGLKFGQSTVTNASELHKHLIAEADPICKKHKPLLEQSEVSNDFFIHVDRLTGVPLIITCSFYDGMWAWSGRTAEVSPAVFLLKL